MAETSETDGQDLDRRRLGLFALFAFGIAWVTAAVLYLNGGLTDSPTVVSAAGVSLTLASVLLPTTYMFAPGVANLLTRALTDEGWDGLVLSFAFGDNWRSYRLAWLAPGVLVALGAALFFAVFPQYFDPTAEAFASSVAGDAPAVVGQGDRGIEPLTLALVTVAAAFAINPLINAVFAFGEELGWRAYLLPKLTPLGLRTAVVLHGVIWGVWHWPLIAMGYEYGFGYVGFPWIGVAVFLPFTVATGSFLAWLTVRSASVWPASLAHGAINATVVIGVVFSRGDPNYLIGPLPIGVVGVLPWVAVAAYLLVRMDDDCGATPSAGRSTVADSIDE